MKKRFLLTTAVIALVLAPVAAFAAAEFTLGGYLKLQGGYQSSNTQTLNFSNFVGRNNGFSFFVAPGTAGTANTNGLAGWNRNRNHGQYAMSANGSRFNLTIKGPEIWGAKITGLFEVDFDKAIAGAASENEGALRLRHAMFRLNWPETELMLGQYWSLLSEWSPDVIDGGAFCQSGAFSLREPQIRITQKFLGDWRVALAITHPENGRWGLNVDANDPIEGQASEMPKVVAKVAYEKDLWGKAAYFGSARGLVAEIGGSYMRTRHTTRAFGATGTWGQYNYNTTPANSQQRNMQNLDNWAVQFNLFVPVIPTYTQNLANTMSLLFNAWVGQGMSTYRNDLPNQDRFLTLVGRNAVGTYLYDMEMVKRWGGFVQAQYYFTNQWYANVVYGRNNAFDVKRHTNASIAATAANPEGYMTALLGDTVKSNQMINANLWYQPIKALKFGLQYTYQRTQYFQKTTIQTAANGGITANVPVVGNPSGKMTDTGDAHTFMFGGFFFF